MVEKNGNLALHGLCIGNIDVNVGGIVTIHGMVGGNVQNKAVYLKCSER